MSKKRAGMNFGIRYSEAFKMQVVRELEEGDLPFAEVRRKYGIRGAESVKNWVRKYGRSDRGKVIRVEKPKEIDEKKELRNRVQVLEKALANAHVELALERAFLGIACRRAGIEDVGEFKKKNPGTLGMTR